MPSSARAELAESCAAAACISRSRRPEIGSGCATIVRYSVAPATDSRSMVRRGFGHREAAEASARATSTPARMARTRGLSGDSFATASASVNDIDCAPAPAGTAAASTAQSTAPRIATSNKE